MANGRFRLNLLWSNFWIEYCSIQYSSSSGVKKEIGCSYKLHIENQNHKWSRTQWVINYEPQCHRTPWYKMRYPEGMHPAGDDEHLVWSPVECALCPSWVPLSPGVFLPKKKFGRIASERQIGAGGLVRNRQLTEGTGGCPSAMSTCKGIQRYSLKWRTGTTDPTTALKRSGLMRAAS